MKSLQTILLVLMLLPVTPGCQNKTVSFVVCADVHKDVMHDADQRLQEFIREMNEKDLDFIIQVEDFTQPQEYNTSFLDIWNSFNGPAYHVPGNHDMDNDTGTSYSGNYILSCLDMTSRYYSFDKKGYDFIVLDGNDKKDPPQRGYPLHIGAEQMAWLTKDLSFISSLVVVFSHQRTEILNV
jgi:calcineurin-like phosphoesterase family protein